ncbi:MAG: ATP-binding protein [Deltaproteobacteria bacterium]|nr:ATP-binding protein [Deltaproteobacteria bacterium]
MAYIPRWLELESITSAKSLFLFGPRQTGKTSLLQHTLSGARFLSLLDSDLFLSLSQRPSALRELVQPHDTLVVIDEIQKLPLLLDEVHLMIESRGTRFLLTGSSARKLRRGGVNLLGGRARSRTLHPLVQAELGERFELQRALNVGLVPSIYLSERPLEDLRAYATDYLREEIAAEGLTRNVPAFSRFLEVAALCNGQMINYSSIASDAQVPVSTVREYFQILEDTLLARRLPAWQRSKTRKAVVTPKFYFFDVGVARYLQHRRGLQARSPEFGEAFEAYLFHELSTYQDYTAGEGLCYWRSKSGFEVDFILGEKTAIEVKAKDPVGQRDLRGLEALREEKQLERYIMVALEKHPRRVGEIDILPWDHFLKQLWAGELCS